MNIIRHVGSIQLWEILETVVWNELKKDQLQ